MEFDWDGMWCTTIGPHTSIQLHGTFPQSFHLFECQINTIAMEQLYSLQIQFNLIEKDKEEKNSVELHF